MTETLQTAGLPRQGVRKQTAAAALTALGVVYGDIGTSTLYGLEQAVGAPTPDTVMGIVSLILWALLLIVALKYAILMLRADNHGECGIVALLALLDARRAPRGSWRASLLIVGLIRAALLYGDGVITPAISVLSAIEGLKIDAPGLRANGRSYHHRNPGWSVPGPAQGSLEADGFDCLQRKVSRQISFFDIHPGDLNRALGAVSQSLLQPRAVGVSAVQFQFRS